MRTSEHGTSGDGTGGHGAGRAPDPRAHGTVRTADELVVGPAWVLSGYEAQADVRTCQRCRGTGWADPFDAHDGSPALTWCPSCLGAGLPDCVDCLGAGAVIEPVPCDDCDDDVPTRPRRSTAA